MNIRRFSIAAAVLLMGAAPAGALRLPDITWRTDAAGAVSFSHERHMQKKRRGTQALECGACHTEGRSARRAGMAGMARGESCGACHNGRKAFATTDCGRCHQVRDITLQVPQTGPVVFRHKRHLARHGCPACHTRIYRTGPTAAVGMVMMHMGKSCGACHDGKGAFGVGDACHRCHMADKVPALQARTQ